MYRAILCDDDEIIAQGLTEFIPWERLGIYLCGFCHDGIKAKEMVEQFEPDIIICDVCMPYMSGLELTRYAKQKNSNVRVIVISGYDDFKYAQEALKVGAIDYILKPVDELELTEVLKRAVKECSEIEKQQTITEENIGYFQKNQIECLIYEGLRAFVERYGQECCQSISDTGCEIILTSIDNYEYLAFQMSDEEQKEMNDIFMKCIWDYSGRATVFERRPGTVGCYILGETEADVRQIQNSYIADVQKAFGKLKRACTVTFACSNIHSSAVNLPNAYHEATVALQERFIYSPGAVIFYKKLARKRSNEIKGDFDSVLKVNELVAFIKQGNRKKIDCMIDEMRNQLLEIGGESYLYMKIITGNIFAKLLNELYDLEITEADLGIDSLEEYQKIASLQSMEFAVEYLRKIVAHIVDIMEKNSNHKYYKLISMAENYIDKHYMEHDLSMDKVAKYVHMSTSYFSVIFKNEKGISFTDYLIRIRIEKAKELMCYTDMKAYEISLKVGYDTAAYFSTAFKKVTGYSPSEYKKQLSNEQI